MNRRELIQNISLLLGGTIVGGSIFMQQGCKPATPQVADLLSESKQAWLGELVETILPATKTPGAKEAGVAEFIPVMVRDCYTPENQKIFLEGIATIDKMSNEKYKNDFVSLTPEQRTELLTGLDKEQKEYQDKKKKEDPSHYFRMMKELTLLGFFTSKTGATKAMRYIAIPGKYEGCVPYVKGDKAWAT